MNNSEKCELLKNTIYQLYSKEGRSFSYISRLLELNRKTLSNKVKEWDFPKPKPQRHLNPSNQKFLDANRQKIKARLDRDALVEDIAKEIGCTRDKLQHLLEVDPVLKKARDDKANRVHQKAKERVGALKDQSSREYEIEEQPGELWRVVLGYPNYQVSNYGRIKSYAHRYDSYYLLKPNPNSRNGRLYVSLHSENGRQNLMLARIVAHAFCDGFSETNNTVNHKDGDVTNNRADNLEWVSQSENNKHAYRALNRTKVNFKRYNFSKILYKDQYEFKTVAALARFIGKSETQTRRYMDEPEKHDLKLIP